MLDEGDRYYTDRNLPLLTDIPDETLEGSFEGRVWIKTADGDRTLGDGFTLQFDINESAVLYMGYDQRYTPPAWIRDDFQPLPASIGVNDWPTRFNLFKKNVDAGTVTIYGNYGVGWGSQGTRNYMVILRCLGGGS